RERVLHRQLGIDDPHAAHAFSLQRGHEVRPALERLARADSRAHVERRHVARNEFIERASSRGFSTGMGWPAPAKTSIRLPLIPAAMISAAFGGQWRSSSDATISVGAEMRPSSGSSGAAFRAAIAAQA